MERFEPENSAGWRHYGEKKLAPLRRKNTGAITPEIQWLLYAGNELAPLRRKLTDGSRTYRVDLSGIAAGTAVNLTFDLIGFGASNSNVTLRDIRVSGLPQLHDDVASLAEDNLLSFDPFAQADTQLKPLLASHIVEAPTHGVLAMNADGTFSYTPDLDYFGADSFSYRLSDGPLDSNLATVSISIAPVNDAPVVADVALTTTEDTALVIALGLYASDVDTPSPQPSPTGGEGAVLLTPQIVAGPAHGVLAANADGTYSYTPGANYNGADSFTYKVNDGELDSNIATVSLAITSVNDAPTLGDLNLAAVEDTALAMNLLAAASDIDGDTLTAAMVTGAQHGQVNLNADGSFTYTPDANYNGADSFTYKVNDGQLDSNVAIVNLSIASVNDAPVVVDVALTTAEDTALKIALSLYASDVDTPSPQPSPTGGEGAVLLTPQIVTGPAHGVLTQNADGSFAYTPDANYNGADSFTYKVNDGELDSNIATVSLAITSVNDAPTLGDLTLAAVEDTALAINLLAAATDIEDDALTAAIVAGPLHGQVVINADGSFTYTPDANYNGADSFTYKVNDGELDSNLATVTLAITSVNDAPQGANATVTTLEDTDYVFQLADFGYSDVNDAGSNAGVNNFSAVTISSLPLAGTLTNNGIVVVAGQSISVADIALGLLKFAPAFNANGAGYASFTFRVQDDGGVLNGGVDIDQTSRTMNIDVTAVNDAPVAVDSQAATDEDIPLNLNLLATASDVDGDVLMPVIIAGPLHGQLLSNPDGTFNYVSDLNYFGADSFTYKVNQKCPVKRVLIFLKANCGLAADLFRCRFETEISILV